MSVLIVCCLCARSNEYLLSFKKFCSALCFQLPPCTAEPLRAPDRPLLPCCSTAAPGTPGSFWQSRDTSVGSRTATETREFVNFITFLSYKLAERHHNQEDQYEKDTMSLVLSFQDLLEGLILWFLFSHSPLHLAIIHQQTGVIQQLIHTLLSSQQQNILNTANHLRQVANS